MLKETKALKDLILAFEDSILNDINFFVIEVEGGEFYKNYSPDAENKLFHKCTRVAFTKKFPFIEIKIEGIDELFYPEDVDLGIFVSKKYYATLDEEEAKNWSNSIRTYTAEEIKSDLEKRIAELQEELTCVDCYLQNIEDEVKVDMSVKVEDKFNESGAGI